MDSIATAAFRSWSLSPGLVALLVFAAIVYLRGWLRVRRVLGSHFPASRPVAFVAGLILLYVALESPLDAFSSLLLQAHMVQHLLLMMVAPPLFLLAQPMLPFLRGLPRGFVKEGLGPFLRWPALQKIGQLLVSPVFAWLAYNLSAIAWHVPPLYELALHHPAWHNLEHAVFFWTAILFWWPVVQPWPSRLRWPRWFAVPYLLAADIVNTAISATFVFADKILYSTYAAAPLSSISPHDDQVAAGAIMWVPGSVIYLVPAVMIAVSLLTNVSPGSQLRAPTANLKPITGTSRRRRLDLLDIPGLGKFLRWRYARQALQVVLLCAAVALVIDGFIGPKMAPMNLAGIVPWIYWRGLVIIALLAAGNLFCMACPFLLPRTIARRFLPAGRRWPSFLRSKWIAAGLVAIYLWSYEAFNLWNSPAVTAWVIVGYFVAAFVVDGLFRDASFCKYVCPIGQFNFINSLVSPFEIRVRDQRTCQACSTFDCIKGNTRQRGCELYLFQPKKVSNLDCTFCLDCVHACPHDNVSLVAVKPAEAITSERYFSSIGRLSKRADLAALAMIIVFGGFVNALAMIAPFAAWEARMTQIVPRSLLLAVCFALAMGAIPLCCIWLCTQLSSAFADGKPSKQQLGQLFVFSLVPLGSAIWAAHLSFHFVTGALTAVPVFERLLSLVPNWRLAAQPLFADSIVPFQLLLLDAGLLLTLYTVWRLAGTRARRGKSALGVFLPWGTLALGLYVAAVWIFLQPMQMRGMMMMG